MFLDVFNAVISFGWFLQCYCVIDFTICHQCFFDWVFGGFLVLCWLLHITSMVWLCLIYFFNGSLKKRKFQRFFEKMWVGIGDLLKYWDFPWFSSFIICLNWCLHWFSWWFLMFLDVFNAVISFGWFLQCYCFIDFTICHQCFFPQTVWPHYGVLTVSEKHLV